MIKGRIQQLHIIALETTYHDESPSGQFITTWSLDCLLQLLWLSVYHQKWLVHRWENQAKVEDCLRSDDVVIQQKRKFMINVRTEENPWYPQFLGHTQLILCISLLGLHRVCTSRKSSGPSSNWTILTFSCYWSVVAAIVCMQWYSRNVPKSVVWTWIFVSFREYINFASHITSRVSYRRRYSYWCPPEKPSFNKHNTRI